MEINSFNELFACAKEHGAYLDSFYQDADGQFADLHCAFHLDQFGHGERKSIRHGRH